MSSTSFSIRPATEDDCKDIIRLIKELAEYERMPCGPKIDEDDLRKDGFGERPFYHCFVAELNNKELCSGIVGYVVYFFTYSCLEGRSLYMEDLYVSSPYRRCGIGHALWKRVAQEGIQNECFHLYFAVLNWNTSSIEFYKKHGATNITESQGWNMFRLQKDELYSLAEK
ncbi:diamine acetyltransferase 1-like [Limulus polyphemus]|uniref:Diamine acetyltransferase 1-like n=1 Tax=Limulus polyphemus TaxID=6850 RepID=A0ABM1B1F8_LIMPO|nr:diamine acetyltransferase 1-like [Limulus polyphemus]